MIQTFKLQADYSNNEDLKGIFGKNEYSYKNGMLIKKSFIIYTII